MGINEKGHEHDFVRSCTFKFKEGNVKYLHVDYDGRTDRQERRRLIDASHTKFIEMTYPHLQVLL